MVKKYCHCIYSVCLIDQFYKDRKFKFQSCTVLVLNLGWYSNLTINWEIAARFQCIQHTRKALKRLHSWQLPLIYDLLIKSQYFHLFFEIWLVQGMVFPSIGKFLPFSMFFFFTPLALVPEIRPKRYKFGPEKAISDLLVRRPGVKR